MPKRKRGRPKGRKTSRRFGPASLIVKRGRVSKIKASAKTKKDANRQRASFRASGLKTTTYYDKKGPGFRVYGYR